VRRYEHQVKTESRSVLVEHTCDLCGRPADVRRGWASDSYTVDDATVTCVAKSGESYPEGGNVKSLTFDICPTCFRTVLVPFLESKGAKPSTEEADF
jgi:hypothetical protein